MISGFYKIKGIRQHYQLLHPSMAPHIVTFEALPPDFFICVSGK